MSRRSESFDKHMSEKMQDLDYARGMLLASIEEFGDSAEDALKRTIQQMGIKEFSEISLFPIQNISEFIRGKRKLKVETLDKYLAIFKLKSKIVVVEQDDAA